MKILLIFLTTSYFLSFTNTSHANSTHNKTVFTITHKADDDEPVAIYFYKEDNTGKSRKMLPGECVNVTHDQFPYLTVMTGVDMDDSFKVLCISQYKKHNCQPQNYNIIDEGIIVDDYVMRLTEEPNTSPHCQDIDVWIESEPIFTITNKTNSIEDIYISLRNSNKISSNNNIHRYMLEPKECLKVKASQFNHLIVDVSDSLGIFGFTRSKKKINYYAMASTTRNVRPITTPLWI